MYKKQLKPKIAAVISSYNRGKAISDTINSLLEQTLHFEKIILIDDGSSDEKKVPKFSNNKIVQIFLKKNIGVVWGRNLGLSKCSECDYVLLIDDDIVLHKDSLKNMMSAFQENSDCVGSMPVVYFLSNKDKVWSSGSGVNLTTGQTMFFTEEPAISYSEIPAATSVILVRTRDIIKSGWYDPLYYFCYEDADFYYRIRKINNGKIYCAREARAYHDIPQNLSLERVARRSYHIARGRVIFLSRYGKSRFLNVVFVMLFSLYYGYLGVQYGHMNAFLKYWQGFFDGVILWLRGSVFLTSETSYESELNISKKGAPLFLKATKVRE